MNFVSDEFVIRYENMNFEYNQIDLIWSEPYFLEPGIQATGPRLRTQDHPDTASEPS